LFGFSVSGNMIANMSLTINNEVTATKAYRVSCGDINNDGFEDIVLMPWGKNALPKIYVNDGAGNFNLVNSANWPAPATEFRDTSPIYVDIDGDGIRDMVTWPLTAVDGSPARIQYQIFKGLRNISSSDLTQ
jgi:hypothetical protein